MKDLILGFSKQEVIALTGVTNGALRYWNSQKLIEALEIPIGSGKSKTYFYSFEQLIGVKAVDVLRDKVHPKAIKAVTNFIYKSLEENKKTIYQSLEDNKKTRERIMILSFDDRYEVYVQGDDAYYLKVMGKDGHRISKLNLFIIPSIREFIEEVVEVIKSGSCKTIDIERFEELSNFKISLSLAA